MVGNCGDCIHFESCSVWNEKFIALRIKRQSVCEHFKNKADFVEVKHGHFIRNERNIPKMKEFHINGYALSMNEKSIFYTCSCCGSWCGLHQNYCSECGAEMCGKDDENDT